MIRRLGRNDEEVNRNSKRAAFVRPLDVLNFALVDVNGAIKPYLNVFLFVKRHWSDGAIGLVSTVSGLVGIAAQAPAGAAIDATRDKRIPLLIALIVLSVGPVIIGVSPRFWPILIGSLLIASIAGILSPAVSALTVASTSRRSLARRLGRNSAFERGGNAIIAIAIGAIGWMLPDRAVFLLVPALCVIAAAALFSIPKPEEKATERSAQPQSSGWKVLLESRPLLVFALSVGIFHFANGPLLTLVAQDVSRGHPQWSSTVISICIVGAQAVMVPMALLVGHRADCWGRKPLLIVGFLALVLRAILYCLWHNPFWLIGVQLLDGVGAGLLSAAKPLVVADIMEGTGRYNLALGIVGTLQGVGAALSFVIAGTLVQHAGFNAAYLASGGAALLALVILVVLMPETLQRSEGGA